MSNVKIKADNLKEGTVFESDGNNYQVVKIFRNKETHQIIIFAREKESGQMYNFASQAKVNVTENE